jgi:hypothetical protein
MYLSYLFGGQLKGILNYYLNKMTPIEEVFIKLETLNQNDFIDWLLSNKQTLIENGKMYLHQRQESSKQNTTGEMA